ncbi:hypothetical protein [Desulfovibrio ferrophilus]|uniref:Outer membrane lipoprotein Slp n=1 Tax=Desulfovibrio ferrophilus TaxID=241368 RepID=A0A2Z6B030_9BACT|nr:hypothetical protein [Desulfovibrio ferrophilus]BBD08877.1 outer membrane lipoprotein Slp [Desulfovibrio ferrophilus]
MPHHRTLVLCLALAVLLAGCTRIPTTLSPVPEALPDEASAYPPDAIHAMRGIIGHLQGETLRGTRFTPEAHHALAAHGFHYSGFRVTHHRLLRYAARADGPTGRTTSGAATLSDSNGRRAGIVYSSIYTVDENGVNIDMAQVTPIYTRTPVIRVFLVPKDGLPAPAATWTETYKTMRRLDSMPEGGLEDARPLDTHALAVFVLDRTAPDADVQLSLDIPELKRILPIVRLKSDDYRDYDGWRVAIVRVNPAMQAGL